MQDLGSIREKINEMGKLTLRMQEATFDGFMQHDLEILSGVLKEEERLNQMERDLTAYLIEVSKIGIVLTDTKRISLLTNIIEHFEEIGDYLKDIIERIEIKIEEKLLFSQEALDEYHNLYQLSHDALSDVVRALAAQEKKPAEKVLAVPVDVAKLIEGYRQGHTKRLICGTCDPRTGNMYLNLLDFTAQIFSHSQAIARSVLELLGR